jgi:hypothetical protein
VARAVRRDRNKADAQATSPSHVSTQPQSSLVAHNQPLNLPGKRWSNLPGIWLYQLRRRQPAALAALLIATFVLYFYAADLKGIWNDDAVRLTIANGGIPSSNLEARHPGSAMKVFEAMDNFAPQPAYLLVVNCILRLTRSYSVIPIVTTNLLIFLSSAVGVYFLARPILSAGPRLLAVLLYVWNGFAMMHVLQVREYPLILWFIVYNSLFFQQLLRTSSSPRSWSFWSLALGHCLTAVGAFYTTKWAPFFLWPQGVLALLSIRRRPFWSLTTLGSLAVAALACLPSVLSLRNDNLVFALWDKQTPSIRLLLTRLHIGTEHLIIGSSRHGPGFLQVYYWCVLLLLCLGLILFVIRFFRERIEIQHLVLTPLGFLAFQVGYFFFREPLSTWARYFVIYLPYVVLLIPLILSRVLRVAFKAVHQRVWAFAIIILVTAVAGLSQIGYNYRNPYVDHGPDFREVYRYLISRVGPEDTIVVGLITNRMALTYYWPTPAQIKANYDVVLSNETNSHPNIWTVSYQDENSQTYQRYLKFVQESERRGYQLRATRVLSNVKVRQFQMTSLESTGPATEPPVPSPGPSAASPPATPPPQKSQADLAKTFAASTEILSSLKTPEQFAAVKPYAAVNLTPQSDGLRITATGNDPAILLPAFSGAEAIAEIIIDSPADSTFQLFYRLPGMTNFSETCSVRAPIKAGKNTVYVRLPAWIGALRLDPGQVQGEYLLESVQVKRVP